MRFGVLGPLAVWTEEGAEVRIPGVKVRALLADLLVHAGAFVAVDRLLDDLWGDAPPANAEAALHSKVSQLRRALEKAEAGSRTGVRYRAGGYALDVGSDRIDRSRFEALAERARRLLDVEPRSAAALLDEALALWRGPPLPEFADQAFARASIAEIEEAKLAAVEARLEARLALGEHAAVVGELDRLVGEHPWRERLRGQHMRALHGAGRQADALASFQQLRTRLVEDLGVDPSSELSTLNRAILAQDPSLDPPQRATRSGRPPTNLPTPRTGLVGRDAAVRRVRDLLGGARLVTLTGVGGVGKTRLAFETAAALLDQYPDGVWAVELAAYQAHEPATATTWVAEQVAGVLGVHDDRPGEGNAPLALLDRLVGALQQQALLLVLDDCDHVREPVAALADRVLAVAPDVRLLATSRQPLGLSGEQLWSVPPLAVPDSAATLTPERLRAFDGVHLFIERATAADPDFSLTGVNAQAVADLCRRLDGLPLALELAAARVRALPVGELAARLDDRFRLLATGAADTPRRQQTLWALIDWSWALLPAAERAVLRRLSVFVTGATLPAAEAVCADGAVQADDVLALIASLVDHSLVVVGQAEGGTRYRLLETIQAYGLERLEQAGELDRTRGRHVRWYAELAEIGEQQLRGPQQQPWLERLSVEASDVRAAVEWSVSHDAGLALRLVAAMAWYWYLRGRQGEASRLLAHALQGVKTEAPAATHAKALAWLGALGSLEQGLDDPLAYRRAALDRYAELDDASGLAHAKLLLGGLLRPWEEVSDGGRLIEEALGTFRRAKDTWGVAAALSVRGWIALGHGDVAGARRDGHEASVLFAECEDRWGQVRTAELLGQTAELHGAYARAAELHRTALEGAEALGLWAAVAQQTSRLGRLAALDGDDDAVALHERALRLSRELSLDQGVVFARVGLGLVTRRQGQFDDAEAHFRAVLDWHRERGFHSGTALCLAELGFIAEQRGDPEHAHALHRDGLAAAQDSGDLRALALASEGLAGAAAAGNDAETAASLLGAATAVRQAAGGLLPASQRHDVDRVAASAAAQLGEQAYTAIYQPASALQAQAALQLVQTLADAAERRSP